MREKLIFTPDTNIGEAGRLILAAEFTTIQQQRAALLGKSNARAVHEARKAIRRTFTAFNLFAPFYEPGVVRRYRRQLRKIMRHLGNCRDATVFLDKLAYYGETAVPLPDLQQYWQARKRKADEKLRRYLSHPKRSTFFDEYQRFLETPGMDIQPDAKLLTPVKVRHWVPLLAYRQLANVRAYEDYLDGITVKGLHELRIHLKELRYTLGFFAPLLGAKISEVRAILKQLQELLGELNDVTVALEMLDKTSELETAVTTYRSVQEAEMARLIEEFPTLWMTLNSEEWRLDLATSLAVL